MKKFILSIFAIFYLGISSGFTVHMHYCMNKLAGWDLEISHETENACDNCGMPQNSDTDCCKVEQKLIKLDDVQKATTVTFSFIKSLTLAGSLPGFQFNVPVLQQTFDATAVIYNPPKPAGVSIFLRDCNFRI